MARIRSNVHSANKRDSPVARETPCFRNPTPTKRNTWSIAEDKSLIALVELEGACWAKHARLFKNKSAKQVRERYTQHLKPGLKREKITPEEGEKILRLVASMDHKWADIARQMDGRSDNDVKNWYWTEVKKRVREESRLRKKAIEMAQQEEGQRRKQAREAAHLEGSGRLNEAREEADPQIAMEAKDRNLGEAAAAHALCDLRKGQNKMDISFLI